MPESVGFGAVWTQKGFGGVSRAVKLMCDGFF